MSFKTLKQSSGNLEKLTKELEKINNPTNKKDENYWKPEVDKAGNAFAVIRFLPAPEVDGEDAVPWVRIFDHGFQGPGGWYIENSLTTLNQADPVSELNSKLWNSGIDANKEVARKQKRRLKYISNILVISDPKNKQNEGKVFKFKYGKKIMDMITEAYNPEFEADKEKAFDPFDFWKGANFNLKQRKVEGYPNYDKSTFDPPSVLFDSDKKLEEIYKQEYSLKELVDTKNFKSYTELTARLTRVLGEQVSKTVEDAVNAAESGFTTPKTQKAAPPDDTDDEELEYFKRLASKED